MNRATKAGSGTAVASHQAVLEGLPAGVMVTDIDGNLDYLNSAAEALFGLDLLEVRGQPLVECIVPSDGPDRLRQIVRRVVRSGRWEGALRLERGERERGPFTVHWSASLVRDEHGDPAAIVAMVEELDPNNRTEAALIEALEQFRALAESMPALVGLIRDDGRPPWCNRQFTEFTGLTHVDLESGGWRSLVHPDDAGLVPSPEVREPWQAEVRLRRKDGEYRWMALRAGTVLDHRGKPIGLVGIAAEVQEHRMALAAAEEALRELDAIYQSAPVGLGVLDRQMRFVRVNELLAEMNGRPVRDHIGRTPVEVIPAVAGMASDEIRKVLREGEPVVGLELRTDDPRAPRNHRHYLENWVPLKDDSGEVVGISMAVADVTDRKHAELELLRSRERLERVLDTLPEAVVVTAADGTATFANQRWVERTGVDVSALLADDGRKLFHPDDYGRIRERWQIAMASGKPMTATYRLRQADGTFRWQLTRAVPVRDATGEITEWIGTYTDIDDQKQQEEALAAALEELSITYRRAPVGLAVLDLDLRYVRANEQLAAVGGVAIEDMLGRRLADLVPDLAGVAEEIRDRIVKTGEAVLGVETEGMAPGLGDYRYCLENWTPIKDSGGNVIAISVSVEDVTSLKRAEQDLQRKHAELDAIFQTTPVGLALLDRDLRYVRVNERLAELNRLPLEEHIGRSPRDIVPGDLEHIEEVTARVLRGERVLADTREIQGDGTRRWLQTSWVPVHDESDEIVGIGMAVEDVTPLKRAELGLQAALAELSTTYRYAPVGLAVFDPAGRFVRVNDRLAAMHGLALWEHIGRSTKEILGDHDWARPLVEQIVATGEPVEGAEVTLPLPVGSGTLRHVRVSCAPMRNEAGEMFAIVAAIEDVTDMKENETLLMESEHRLRNILDAVPAAVGVTDSHGDLVYLNRHWIDYSGMNLLEARTDDLAQWFHPDEVKQVIAGWNRARQRGEPFEVLQRLRRADGDYRWHLGRSVPMRDPEGNVTAWVSTNIDIHDRKTTEEQLEAALGEIEATYQGAPIGLGVVDRELRYVRVNEVLAAANGMPVWKHVGRRLGALARCPADEVAALVKGVLETGEPCMNVELTTRPRRGRARAWRFSMVPLRDAQREIIGVSISAEDVTSRKRAEDEVRTAHERLGMILDSIRAPVIVLDDSGAVQFGNRQFWEYTGLSHESAATQRIEPMAERILHPAEREGVLAGFRAAMDRPGGFSTVCRLRRHDGEYRWHMGAAMALPPQDDGNREWVATYMDFQDRKTAEEALQAANRVKDEFLGMVSHELRTPLTTVLGLADMLRRRFDQMDRETRREALEQLEEDAKRLNELIENMLLLSRAERAAFDPEPVLLQRLVPMVVAAAAERHQEAHWEIDVPDELPPVAGKTGWIEQVLQNLVANAVKYGGSPPQIRLEARHSGADVEISVLDRGRGVRSDEAEMMFEPFYRSPRSSSQPGVGLGLAVCRRLVELMDGEIGAAPRAGGGTVVTFRLRGTSSR